MTVSRDIEQRKKENLSLKPAENKETLQEIIWVVFVIENNHHWEAATVCLYSLCALAKHGIDVSKKKKKEREREHKS